MSIPISYPSNTYMPNDALLNLINSIYNNWEYKMPAVCITKESSEEDIKNRLQSLIKEFTELLDIIKEKELQNEQWCLDGMDEMNKQSVRF